MQNQTSHQDISQDDLKRMKKDEIVELFMQLQQYTKKIEVATRPDNVLVRVDEKAFFDDDFFAEFTAFIAEISSAEPFEKSGREYASMWIKIDGRLRPNLDCLGISAEHSGGGWLRNVSATYLIPRRVGIALKNFAHALRSRQSELCKEYDERGKNFLVQMVKNDLIGDASK